MRKNGHVVYRTRDGGQVTDMIKEVRTDTLTAGSATLALLLAKDRFAGQAIVLNGTAEFQGAVVAAAIRLRLEVTFNDPMLEARRSSIIDRERMVEQIAAERAAAASPVRTPDVVRPKVAAPEPAEAGARAYVAERNARRATVSDILKHRLWTPADAGEATYEGHRRFPDRTESILLKRGGEMLVKPVTPAQTARVSNWSRGRAVTLDPSGRFVDGPTRGLER